MKREKKKGERRQDSTSELEKFDRRTFVKLVPAIGVAAATIPHLAADGVGQTPTPMPTPTPAAVPSPSPTPTPAPLRVTKEMLRGAEQLFGIELTEAHELMALPNVNTNLERYETLRKIDVPLDTEPATLFHPALPGKKFNIARRKFALSKAEIPKFAAVEDLAFATATQLAELIRTSQSFAA